MSKLMQNLNGHLLCAIDTETTGLDPRKHDIIQLAVIPLTAEVKPDPNRTIFSLEMKPRRPENIDHEALRINRLRLHDIMTKRMDSDRVLDLFVEWYEKQKQTLGYNKQIIPLGHNWPFDREFIADWLGPATFSMIFNAQYRDTMAVASFCNDRAGWLGNDFPYPKVTLSYLCTQLKIERTQSHDALDDARVTAEAYRRMIQEFRST